ncbi:MAG: PQQ-binding-like beta-propeller repeat protein, partial [Planctomycetota bacterium]
MTKTSFVPTMAFLLLLSGAAAGEASRTPAEQAGPGGEAAPGWPQWRGINRDAVSAETGLNDEWSDGGPALVWRTKIGPGFSSVSVSGGRLYTMWDESDTQYLFCLDARSGDPLWRVPLGPAFTHHYGDGPRSTPLIDDGVVFAIGTSGLFVAVDGSSGETLWQHDLVKEYDAKLPSYGYSSSPLIAGDRLIVEAGGPNAAFMAFDRKSGKVAWRAENDQPAYSSPLHVSIDGVEQAVFWSAHGLHAVALQSGALLWRYAWETFCPVTGDPLNTGTPIFMAPDRMFISSGSGAAVIRISHPAEQFVVETIWKSEQM